MKKDVVKLKDIIADRRTVPENIEFVFSCENYDAVINSIIKETNEYKKLKERQ